MKVSNVADGVCFATLVETRGLVGSAVHVRREARQSGLRRTIEVPRGLLPPANPVTGVTSENSPTTTIELLNSGVALSRSLSTPPPRDAGQRHSVWARPPSPS